MRRIQIVAIGVTAILTIVALARGQNTSTENPAIPGRYQLFAATTLGQDSLNAPVKSEPDMFMIDTATGKVWHYVPSGPFKTPRGNPGFTPDLFRRVLPVEGLEGDFSQSMQQTIEYFDKNPATPITPKR